jgi:hypothetical protein
MLQGTPMAAFGAATDKTMDITPTGAEAIHWIGTANSVASATPLRDLD